MKKDTHMTTVAVLVDRGNNALNSGRLAEALEWYDKARDADPLSPPVLYNRGLCLQKLGRNREAEEEYRLVLSLDQGFAEAHTNLGNMLAARGCLTESLGHYLAAATIDPDSGAILNNLGNSYMEAGDLVKAIKFFRRAVSVEPSDAFARSNLIMALEYSSETDRDGLFSEVRAFQDSLCAKLPQCTRHENTPDPERRLRIGYVSPDFKRHPVGFHLLPALRHHDKTMFEVFCYSDTLGADELTEELRACADVWRDIAGRSDEEVEKIILGDGIDILIDLTGHTAFNRLLLFARKPAPVQATWLGYFNTTGLDAMDYLISDGITIPPGEEKWFAERIVRLPDSRFCYAPPAFAPEVAPPPVLVNGFITFGSFNTILKVTGEVVELWSRIMHAVPDSRLLLKSRSFDSGETTERYREMFARYGISGERLDLRGSSNHPTLLMQYGEMDIALDPFPFSGGLTSCEAMWMGVPVITLPGKTPISRQTRGFLRVLKMQELVARAKDHYVAIAAELASDRDRLIRMRSGLRTRMAVSPLCDGERFARNLEQAFREMWATWCEGHRKDVPMYGSTTVSGDSTPTSAVLGESGSPREERRLCIGGETAAAGWEVLNSVAGSHVDLVSDARRLDPFGDETIDILYAPHVLGRFDYRNELSDVLLEWRRVLKPGGSICLSVPDLEILSRMLIDPEYSLSPDERFMVMQMMFGCHADPHDYNQSGFTWEILHDYLFRAGFTGIKRVGSFGFFDDASVMLFKGISISLNIRAEKPLRDDSEGEALCDNAARVTAAGDTDEGERLFLSVLERFPDFPRALHALGVIAFRRGESARAVELITRAVTVKPDFSGAWNNLGNVYLEMKRHDEAAEAYRRALEHDPSLNISRRNLGLVYAKQGEPGLAIELLEEAVASDPGYAEAHADLGALLLRQGRVTEAAEHLEQALILKPDWPECHYNLANALRGLSRTAEALVHYRRTLELRPGYSQAWGNMALTLSEQGKHEESFFCYRNALAGEGDSADTHSGFLMFLNSIPGVTQAEIYAESREWERRYALAFKEEFVFWGRSIDPERRLRVGFVSPDFRRHSVSYFIGPLLQQLDRSRFSVYCYADVLSRDDVTERLCGEVDHWREITGMSDEEASALIGRDEIDLLVDLAGHSAHGRILLFARRPAPVQVTWLGFPNTTGLSTIDYRLTDTVADPPGVDDHLYSERLYRLDDGFLCYQPPECAPPISVSPCNERGFVTFGCFHALRKVHDESVAHWAEILSRVDGSRIMMKDSVFSDPSVTERYILLFGKYGISADRVVLECPQTELRGHLSRFAEVDIVLDTFPYNGTTSTCESLWMGVPVVTLKGDRHSARVGASILNQLDLGELVAESPREYIEKAVALASDAEQLVSLRFSLRSRMALSPLCDGRSFARTVGKAFQDMWRTWCAEQEKVAFDVSRGLDRVSNQPHKRGVFCGITQESEDGEVVRPDFRGTDPECACRQERHAHGLYAMEKGDFVAAETLIREELAVAPSSAALLNDLGVVLIRQGRTEEATDLFQQSVIIDSDNAFAYYNLGKSQFELGKYSEALLSLSTAVSMDGGNSEWFLCLGNALNKIGNVSAALRCYMKALRLDPQNAWSAVNLGNLQLRVGDAGPGLRTLEKAAGLVTPGSEAHASILMGLYYLDEMEAGRIYEESRKWGDALLRALPQRERPRLGAGLGDFRIRVGYVSADFRQHSVAYFLDKVLSGHSRERFQVFCYANMTQEDDVTGRLRSYTDVWRPISNLDDEAVARLIRDDRIDILVDLSGHTEGNRLGVFARRPAPVQVTWLGYPGTTGLATMDYRLTDAVADPEGPADLYHTERLWRVPDGFLCYAPPEESPPPVSPPCLTGNRITFGSFNNPAKMSRETLRCWAGILGRVPGSTLLLKIYHSSDEATRKKWMKVLNAHGIDSSRVEILPRVTGLADHLALYGRVDIALDPFPYNGTTTTCEALWMGVPVVALSGGRHSARVSASILKNVGCTELIAGSLDEYCEIAVRLANDCSQLEAYRSGLRTLLKMSPLFNGAGFVARLEQAYRGMLEETLDRETRLEKFEGRDTEHARALVTIAQGSMRAVKLEETAETCRRALALDRECVEAHTLLGCVLIDSRRYGEGIRSFREALDLDPGFVKAGSNLLLAMHYSPHFTGRGILEESLRWQERLEEKPGIKPYRFESLSDNAGRIRIGYLSSDFGTHSISYFFAPLLEFHDRKRFEITCYSSIFRPDRMTERLQGLSEHWRDVTSLDTVELADQIHADGIHILVDLSGHTGRQNRLPVFALRPAPVQVTWLGYPGTTGLAAMDYRLTDALSDPPGSDSLYAERLVRLPGGFLCYGPPDEAPPVGPLPLQRNGYVTFASFNNLAKISDQVIALWTRVLQTVGGCRLIIKSHICADAATCRRLIDRFQSHGSPVERIELRPAAATTAQHLAMYDEVDIALDTFPYNGTTTTCEALWMGVPVVTLAGDRHSARVGTSILTSLGLETLISRSEEEYLNICRSLVSDIDTLADLRDSLRPRMKSSPLCDGQGFARKIERAFLKMWRRRIN